MALVNSLNYGTAGARGECLACANVAFWQDMLIVFNFARLFCTGSCRRERDLGSGCRA